MKKLVFIMFIAVSLLSIVSAKINANCSDGSQVIKAQNEINKNAMKIINGLGVFLIYSEEIPLRRRYSADLIVDTSEITLSNNTNSEKIILLGGSYTVNLVSASLTTAKINIDGEAKEIKMNVIETLKGLNVILNKVEDTVENERVVKGIIGGKQIYLSNDEAPFEKLTIANTTLLVELFSASETNAIIRVYKCAAGNATILIDSLNKTLENKTISNKTEINATETNKTEINVTQNDTEIIKNKTLENKTINNQTEKQNKTVENKTSEYQQKKTNLFKRFANWLKKLFGLK